MGLEMAHARKYVAFSPARPSRNPTIPLQAGAANKKVVRLERLELGEVAAGASCSLYVRVLEFVGNFLAIHQGRRSFGGDPFWLGRGFY